MAAFGWPVPDEGAVGPGAGPGRGWATPDVPRREQEVNIVTTRFGLIQAPESDLIRIPEGLVGFRSFTQYVLLPDPVVAGLSWLQSVTAPELAAWFQEGSFR